MAAKFRKNRPQSNMNKEGKTLHHLPPVWCSAICRNAMSEVCVEQCAIERDCSSFDLKSNSKLEDMPRFPLKTSANMTKEEKFTAVTVYLAKVVDRLKGIDEEQLQFNLSRPSRPMIVYERKVVAEVASSLQDSQNNPVGLDVNKKANQPVENIMSKEKE